MEQKVCYFAVNETKSGEKRIWFGTCGRKEAQIETSLESWEKISEFILGKGFRLVEITPNGASRVG